MLWTATPMTISTSLWEAHDNMQQTAAANADEELPPYERELTSSQKRIKFVTINRHLCIVALQPIHMLDTRLLCTSTCLRRQPLSPVNNYSVRQDNYTLIDAVTSTATTQRGYLFLCTPFICLGLTISECTLCCSVKATIASFRELGGWQFTMRSYTEKLTCMYSLHDATGLSELQWILLCFSVSDLPMVLSKTKHRHSA